MISISISNSIFYFVDNFDIFGRKINSSCLSHRKGIPEGLKMLFKLILSLIKRLIIKSNIFRQTVFPSR